MRKYKKIWILKIPNDKLKFPTITELYMDTAAVVLPKKIANTKKNFSDKNL